MAHLTLLSLLISVTISYPVAITADSSDQQNHLTVATNFVNKILLYKTLN